jgi:predicted phosphodiesterase
MRVGIIGDLHLPYTHPEYLGFVKAVFRKAKVNKVVQIGDLVDNHALSFHESEPTLKGANGELLDARKALKPWFKAFPKMTITLGNHDLIPARQLKRIGMDSEVWMRPLHEVYDMPKGWEIVDTVTIDGVLYHHGYTSAGVNGFRNDANKRMCRTVSGHAHGNAGISASASDHRLVWGMAVGCGVDVHSMAMVYGRHFLQKPIVACGTVINGEPQVHYMSLGEHQ